MTNIVIYARYSSDKQTEQSIEGQLRVCHEYAEKQGFNILHEYIDRAMTGTNDNRPAFQQMIEDSNKKQFDYVLVYKLDRFSRSKYDNAIYKHKLQLNGVRVISATETISNTPEGALMEGLLEMFAELYSKDLSQKVKRGMRENKIKGLFNGGYILYGYKVVNKHISIDEEKAQVVKMFFEEYAKGTSKKEIISILNKSGYKNNQGKNFSISFLDRALSNKKYIGVAEDESLTAYPAIIDKELFEKVQKMIKHKTRFKTRTNENFILTGKLFCGTCGDSMFGTSGHGKLGNKYLYYGCNSKLKKHTCSKKNCQKEELEMRVLNKIIETLNDKANIEIIADGIVKAFDNNINKKALDNLHEQIVKIDKKLDNITNQLIDTTNTEIISRLNSKAKDLTEEKEIYLAESSKIKISLSVKHSKQDIMSYLSLFANGNIEDEKYKKRLLDKLVNAIYVFDNFVYVHFNILNTESAIPLENIKNELNCKCSTDILGGGLPGARTRDPKIKSLVLYQLS